MPAQRMDSSEEAVAAGNWDCKYAAESRRCHHLLLSFFYGESNLIAFLDLYTADQTSELRRRFANQAYLL